MRALHPAGLALLAALLPGLFPAAAQDKRSPIMIEGKSFLPLRVIARPFSHVYNKPDEHGGIGRENVPPFSSYFVYTRPTQKDQGGADAGGKGWYEVGSDNRGSIIGWMRNEDVMEWKQTLCLEYEHPQGRQPVLLFEERESLKDDLLKSPADRRARDVRGLYEKIQAGTIPNDFPVLSMEPKRAVDISSSFYLMPILEHEEIEVDSREGRLLKVAAATGAGAGRGATVVADEDYRNLALVGSELDNAKLDDLTIDLVFVMDLTLSMRPFLKATQEMIAEIAAEFGSEFQGRIRFGFWGYRDSEEIDGIEFTTRNFTPALQPSAEFASTMRRVTVTETDSVDYEEDMFAGMGEAMNSTRWTPNALRFIFLIGDAPSHEPGHKWNSTGKDAETLRVEADRAHVSVYALHLQDSKFPQYHDAAKAQLEILGSNRGLTETGEANVAYQGINAREVDSFVESSIGLLEPLYETIMTAMKQSGQTVKTARRVSTAVGKPEKSTAIRQEARKLSEGMVRAALVDWIGRQQSVQAPRDIVAWVIDKDLIDPSIQSLKVNVLLTKNQLDALNGTLKTTLQAGLRGQISGRGFFTELQSVSATATVKPESIRNAKRFADTGLAPEFLEGLPYKSEVMNLTPELWSSWSEDRQQKFLLTVESKIEYYKTIHDKPERWIALAEGADEDEKVAPIPLQMLP